MAKLDLLHGGVDIAHVRIDERRSKEQDSELCHEHEQCPEHRVSQPHGLPHDCSKLERVTIRAGHLWNGA